MTNAALKSDMQEIVVEEVFPHAPELIWKTLTTAELIGRWIPMPIVGFKPVKGNRFTFETKPAGAWDGLIHLEVLEVIPNERLVYTWRGGHAANTGYGAPLDTIVTWTLSRAAGGTRLRLVHSGFVLPRNEMAFTNMGAGWKKIVGTIGTLSGDN